VIVEFKTSLPYKSYISTLVFFSDEGKEMFIKSVAGLGKIVKLEIEYWKLDAPVVSVLSQNFTIQ